MKRRGMLGVLIIALLSGCSTANIKPNDTSLEPHEGIVVSRILTNVEGGHLLIHHKGQSMPSAKFEPVKAPVDLKVIKMSAGKAYFSRILWRNMETWRDDSGFFTIKPGMINYVGDFVMEWGQHNGRFGVIALHVDKEEETIKAAKLRYPDLFAKYEYRKGLPEVEVKNVEGYKKIDEIEAIKKKQNVIKEALDDYVSKQEKTAE